MLHDGKVRRGDQRCQWNAVERAVAVAHRMGERAPGYTSTPRAGCEDDGADLAARGSQADPGEDASSSGSPKSSKSMLVRANRVSSRAHDCNLAADVLARGCG